MKAWSSATRVFRNVEIRLIFSLMLGITYAAIPASPVTASAADIDETYRQEVRPLLAELCFECHGAEKQKGDIRFDTRNPDLTDPAEVELWHDAMDQINLGEMPPRKAGQPDSEQRKTLVAWMSSALRHAAETSRYNEGRVVTRRLTRYEYANTMRDLLGVDLDFAREVPPDPASAEGFVNNGATLEMSPTQIETYLSIARKGMAEAIVTGERPKLHQFTQDQTAKGNLPNRKVQGHVAVNPEFILDLKQYPRAGEFEVRVQARAAIPKGQDFPRIQLTLGHVPGIIHVPRGEIGSADVSTESQVFTFRGRMEDFPLPGPISFGSSGFKGMIVMVDFVDADGKELRYPDQQYARNPAKPKKGQKPKPRPTPPPFGSRLDIKIESIEFEAPVFASWPPPSHRQLVGDSKNPDARELLKSFMTRAYRRPVTAAELDRQMRLFATLEQRSDSFEAAIRETFASVLVSPHFLYRVESRPEIAEARATPTSLSPYELASRLSYFLWSSMPDDRLFELAASGRLHDPQVLDDEVSRMLADPRAKQFAGHFTDQWLDLEALDRIAVNPEFFPNFNNALKDDMRTETHAVFAEILHSDGSALDLLDSDWTMLNRPLARHYGLAGPRSSAFEMVALNPEDHRGGLLTQSAFLLAASNGEDSHPIKRAVWILDRLLDSPPAPPPPDVPDLDPANPDLAGLSLKDQLAVHREKESCTSCHEGIDPWGIPLENYDAVGRWRSQIKDAPVDAASTLPNGETIDGIRELQAFLLSDRRDWFARSLVKRLLSYALGRSLDLGDRPVVETLTEDFVASDFRLQRLIIDLVQSEAFLTK
tara:strand:+ start:439 stop:2904 length:2466 start_codon:yes stop_codon:yes gene_type:complete